MTTAKLKINLILDSAITIYATNDQGITMESLALNTLQQNSSAEHSRGVVIPKEEPDETLKEEIKTSDKDKTQVDISGSQHMDSSRNQDQVTN